MTDSPDPKHFDHLALLVSLIQHDAGRSFALSVAPDAFRAFSERGITIREAEPPAEWDRTLMDLTTEERTVVDVDVRRIVEVALDGRGFTIDEKDSVLILRHPAIVENHVAIVLPLNGRLGSLELRARFTEPVIVRLGVELRFDEGIEAAERMLGIWPYRLRDLFETDPATFEAMAAKVSVAAVATETAAVGRAAPVRGNPAEIVNYAMTAQAHRFEVATAAILADVLGIVLSLGSNLAGKPVPDGVLVENAKPQATRAALFECKSKSNSNYTFTPKDADQLARYKLTLDRLEAHLWRTEGFLVATSDADATDLAMHMTKDTWRRLSDRRLVVVPASVLLRWHVLNSAEDPAFSSRTDKSAAWIALWDLVVGEVPESRLYRYFPQRDIPYRVLTTSEAEVIWLAGAGKPLPFVTTAFGVLQGSSTEDRTIESRQRPRILQALLRALRPKRGIGVRELSEATGLSERAVEFAIEGRLLYPLFEDENSGETGPNLQALAASIRVSA